MNSLLFSMPGTPVIYYGDEQMGDNLSWRPQRRKNPIVWCPDRTRAGFSTADPNRLSSDNGSGDDSGTNVEAQLCNSNLLLNQDALPSEYF